VKGLRMYRAGEKNEERRAGRERRQYGTEAERTGRGWEEG